MNPAAAIEKQRKILYDMMETIRIRYKDKEVLEPLLQECQRALTALDNISYEPGTCGEFTALLQISLNALALGINFQKILHKPNFPKGGIVNGSGPETLEINRGK